MERFRFANKPGVLPGKPLVIGENASINKLKQVARISGKQRGVALDYRHLDKASAMLVIDACDNEATERGRFEQHGKTVSFRIGGAF